MKKTISSLLIILSITSVDYLFSQNSQRVNSLFKVNSREWVQTNGPGGGYINDIVIDPQNSSILYAIGNSRGIYKSINAGEQWEMIEFPDQGHASNLEIALNTSTVLLCDYHNLSKSIDGGQTWQKCAEGFENIIWAQVIKFDPEDPNIIYIAGRRYDDKGIAIFKSQNLGDTWTEITGNIKAPNGSNVSAIAPAGNGRIFIGINDSELLTWHEGKVFYTSDDGNSWEENNITSTEDRFVWDIYVNPFNLKEVWIGQGPLYNNALEQPILFKSSNGGNHWEPIYTNCNVGGSTMIILSATPDEKIFISAGQGLAYSSDGGKNFIDIAPPMNELPFVDPTSIAINPQNSNILYLPLSAGGIAYSNNGGQNWLPYHNGILKTSINLLASDPLSPNRIYSASWQGEGTYRTDDYGQSWKFLNSGGITHPWDDELLVDPVNPENVWFISDVPYIHKSSDYGDTWQVVNHPYQGNNFNFCSIYAIGQSNNSDEMYVANNGFGLFKGFRQNTYYWDWKFLNLSEIDYTYTLAVHPQNSDIIYSGYNPKPFQDYAMIRKSNDGGETWETSLHVNESYGITSIAMNPQNSDILYAGSTGKQGQIYKSDNAGQSWIKLNEHFTMCTVWGQSQLIMHPNDPFIVYAATWLGGTWKTEDAGANWTLLDQAPISSTALSFNQKNPDIIYLADRSTPTVWKTTDAGNNWQKVADFTQDGSLLVMRIQVCKDTIYASTFHHGLRGGKLYQSTDAGMNWQDITGDLPKGILDIAIDPSNAEIIYVTTNINGSYKSIDGGSTWAKMINFPDVGAYDIEIDPNNTQNLYISCRGGSLPAWFTQIAGDRHDGIVFQDKAGIYKSTNGGETWTQLLVTTASCRAVRQHPDQSDLLFAVDLVDGLMVSTDGGENWIDGNTGLDTKVLTSCVVGEDKILVGTQGCGVYSGDLDPVTGLISWQTSRSNKPIPTVHSMQIEVDPKNSNRIFVGSNPGGNYRSDDGGKTFRDVNGITPSVIVDDPVRQGYYTFAINPNDPEECWVGTWGKGIYKSFNALSLNIPAFGHDMKMISKHIYKIIIDPNQENTVLAATQEGVFKTTDGGDSWFDMNQGLISKDVSTLFLNSAGELYAGTKGYGLYKWDGNSWISINAVGNWGVIWPIWNNRPMYQYTSLLIHPDDNSKMLVGTFPQGIYKSSDDRTIWEERNVGWTTDGVFKLVCHPNDPEIVYAGTYNGMNRSLDFGEHWEMWDNGMPAEQWVFSIDFDLTNPDVMYACSKNGENEGTGREGFHGTVMKSVDGGATWFEITNGLVDQWDGLHQEFYKIIVDHYDHNTIYLAGQYLGIYQSVDAGETWNLWNDGLVNTTPGVNGNNVTNTMVLSADHSMLYFGTAGSGVWRRMIAPILPVNNLCASVNNHQVILKWSFDDIENNFRSYNVYRNDQYFETNENLSPIANVLSVSDTFYIDSNIIQGQQYYYSVTTSDINNYENPHFFTLGPIVDRPVAIQTMRLDTGYVNVAYSDTLKADGGNPPYTWKIVSGNLPLGLSFSNKGIISGVPSKQGLYYFSVKASDSQSPSDVDTLQYEICIIENTSIDNQGNLPKEFRLKQNYPNPFNSQTKIRYELPRSTKVKIEVYNSLGQKIITLLNEEISAGFHEIEFNANKLNSGIYFYKIEAGNFHAIKKALLIK